MLLDPVARAVATAPPDDETVTVKDLRRVLDGRVSFAQVNGTAAPLSDVLAEFGLKPEDFPHGSDDVH
jgi:hypothetical protein